MSSVDDLLNDVRAQIEAEDSDLKEARERLALVRTCASSFYGALRTYRSGSLAAHTMNAPVTDGDGGIVLNRNFYPGLGPEGTGEESPNEVVDDLCSHLGPLIREHYPKARIHTSKRGPKVYFADPLPSGADPTVDLVLALTRKEGKGLWIPNLEAEKWDPSDPEAHISLFNSGTPSFRSTRRKVMRLAKAWNKQFTHPGVASFQICVWAYEFVEPGMGVSKGLLNLFSQAATRLESNEPTLDPAHVSEALAVAIETTNMAKRLRKAADHLEAALTADSEEEVESEVSLIFFKYINSLQTAALAQSASRLKKAEPAAALSLGIPALATTAGASSARAFGGALKF